MNRSPGRPPGGSDARKRILGAARRSFLDVGYHGTTVRAVARSADVDPALVSYYFGSKNGLFGAAMALETSPGQVLDEALSGDPATAAERVAEAVLSTVRDPRLGGALTVLVEQAMNDPGVMAAVRQYVDREIVARFAEFIGGPDARERATAATSVVLGLVVGLYLLGPDPATDPDHLDPDRLARVVTPSLAAALHRPLLRGRLVAPGRRS